MRKRAVSFALCLCMVLSLLPLPALAVGKHPFTDVAATDWFNDSVEYVYEHNLMKGTSDTTFAPYRTTQRGMIVTILHRLEGTPAVASGNPFTDVPKGSNYENAIIWASAKGIVTGYDGITFGPYNDVTRQQMAAIFYRYAQMKGYDTSEGANLGDYADSSQISNYARTAMAWANRAGLINGNSSKQLMPTGNATRAQTAAILSRFCQNVIPQPTPPSNPPIIDPPIEEPPQPTPTSYSVTFDLNYDDAGVYQTLSVKAGEKITKPKNPTRDNYSFLGWYTAVTGGSKFNFKKAINEITTLYAHWSKISNGGGSSGGGGSSYTPVSTYTVTFTSDGNVLTTQTISSGNHVTQPANPEKEDFIFDGWYANSDLTLPYDFNSAVTGNIVLYAKWSSIEDSDSDNDNVPDWVEEYFGASTGEDDSDNDGIDDYTEIYVIRSDPSSADSDLDTDGDGLTNYEEVVTYKTNPVRTDTDYDGLSDGDEINNYHTDPLNEDTDGDGILDGDEVRLDLHPTASDNLIEIDQTLGEDSIDPELLDAENTAIPQISGTADVVLDRSVSLYAAPDESLKDNRAIVGKGVQLEISDSTNNDLQLTFNVNENNSAYVIMRMDENSSWIPVETTHTDTSISATVSSSGTFSVMDLNVLLPLLGVDIDTYYENVLALSASVSGASLMSTLDVADESKNHEQGDEAISSNSNTAFGKVVLNSNSESILEALESDFSELAVLQADSNQAMGQADLVFAIDTTGSMADEISNVANNIISFANTLMRTYNVNCNFALIDYRDIIDDGPETTRIVKNGSSNWYTNTNGFMRAVSALTVDGGGDDPETAVDALEVSRNLDFRSSASKFIVLVTDADYKDDNNYGISSMAEEIGLLRSSGIMVSVITSTDFQNTYRSLYESTGGIYANIYGNFSEELLTLADSIGQDVNEGNWILLNDYQYVSLEEPLSPTSGDSDKDGKSDYDELKAPQQKEITSLVKTLLLIKGVPQELVDEYFSSNDGAYITVYPYTTNPVLPDTDFDGINDKEDAVPTGTGSNWFGGELKTGQETSNVSFKMDYRWFFEDNTKYNEELSVASILLAASIYPTSELSIRDSLSRNTTPGNTLEDVLVYFGMPTAVTRPITEPDIHKSEVGIAHRTVQYNGMEKNIVAVVVRGTNSTIAEWSSNFDIGELSKFDETEDWRTREHHAGFDIAAVRLMRFIDSYLSEHHLDASNTVYWITGHSRGAAIANIIGAYFEDAGKTAFTYTFASPNTTLKDNADSYRSIFNIVNKDDFVPCLPMEKWGYTRYGRIASVSIAKNYEKQWEELTGEGDYNPDTFGMDKTINALADILPDGSDAREECYKYTCKDHGDNSNDTITITNRGTSRDSREKAIAKIPDNALPYCKITRYDGVLVAGWNFDVCQTPAYFMQILAAKMSNVIGNYRFAVELNIADRYESAKSAIIKSAIGGLEHPHYTESYYVLAKNIKGAEFK